MIATSTAVMLGLMYLSTYEWGHVFWSETRFYMAFLMGAAMAAIMLAFMLGMYTNRRANFGIFTGSAVVFILALFLVRSQATIGDQSWMSAMTPTTRSRSSPVSAPISTIGVFANWPIASSKPSVVRSGK